MKIKTTGLLVAVATASAASSILTYFVLNQEVKGSSYPKQAANAASQIQAQPCVYTVKRLGGFKFIKPIQYAMPECEGQKYASLKAQITGLVNTYQSKGLLRTASVYFKDFENGDWIGVNSDARFHPGSLMKLPMMIAALKMSEKDPLFLKKKIYYARPSHLVPTQTFNSRQLKSGQYYSVKELLEYMVSSSDNNATLLLQKNITLEAYKDAYENFGVTFPQSSDPNFEISTREYSSFFTILFNAGYLSFENSEYAVELLSKSEFNLGFKSGLPAGTPVAHKFGEWSDGPTHQLHETGFIYLNGTAYLLTVMTSGDDVQKLPAFIADVARQVADALDKPDLPNTTFAAYN